MPDFERVIRNFSLHIEKDPVEKMKLEAYFKGQSAARKEIAIFFGILAILFVFVYCLVA